VSKRHEAIGIKQAIRFEWMEKTVNLLLSGLDTKEIRQELHEYLNDRMGSGVRQDRGAEARSFAVGILMNTWVTPQPILLHLQKALLNSIEKDGNQIIVAHWAMISAAYPFWFNVARQTGRLLALQDMVTMRQITGRIVEEYGDRQTVIRNVQFVIRSFAFWGVLGETTTVGCYEKLASVSVVEPKLAILLFEAALHATSEAKCALGLLLNNPAFFPFQMPIINGDYVSQHSSHIDVIRYGLDDELLKLTKQPPVESRWV